jgi:dynein heavy chain
MSSLLLKFKETVPIIQALCNPALSSSDMDDVNTQEIFDVLVFVNHENAKLEDMNIRSLQNYSVEQHKDRLEEISERASKEFGNHRTMTKMKDDWEPLLYECLAVAGKTPPE